MHFAGDATVEALLPTGSVDGKYITPEYMRDVAERGSEPARSAFQDATTLRADGDEIGRLLSGITVYPVAEKTERIGRFRALDTRA